MILRITDGTTIINLVWHSVSNRKFIQARDGWTPQVAARRRSQLGGRGPYTDVVEEIVIHVCGETPQEAMSNLATLNQLIEQAEEWAIDARTAPTLIQYSPTGGDVWQAVIVGRAADDDTGAVALSPTFNNNLNAYMIENVRVRFERLGLWLGTDDVVQSSSSVSPLVQAVTLPAVSGVKGPAPGARSPVKLSWDAQTSGTNTCRADGGGFLIATTATSQIVQIEAELATLTAHYSSVADAAVQASGGAVLRYTPAAALANDPIFFAVAGGGRKVDIFAAVRNNGSVSFQITPYANVVSGSLSREWYAPPVVVDTSSVNPQWIFVGSLVLPSTVFTLGLFISALDTPAGSTLDIDHIVLVSRDREDVLIANVKQESGRLRMLVNQSLVVDHQLLTAPQPKVSIATSGASVFTLDYRGDLVFNCLTSINTQQIAFILLLTNAGYWCPVDFTTAPAFSGVTSFKVTATRTRGTLVPQ